MKVGSALVCLDCDELVEQKLHRCPNCSSHSLVPLKFWLKPLAQRPQITKEKQ